MKWDFRLATTMISLFALAGCQSTAEKSVSIEQAKQITAEISKTRFVPPPKQAIDIERLFAEADTADKKKLAALVTIADATSPKSPQALSGFYIRRAFAATQLGRTQQVLIDIDRAVAHADKSSDVTPDTALLYRGAWNVQMGDYSQGVADLEKSYELVQRKGRKAFRTVHLARAYSTLGHVSKARKYIKEADSRATVMSGSGYEEMYEAWSLRAKGLLAQAEGRLDDAEAQARKAIAVLLGRGDWPVPGFVFTRNTSERVYHRTIALLADVLRDAGRPLEAEIEARKALKLAVELDGRYAPHTANMLYVLTRVLFEQGRYEESAKLSMTGIDILRTAGASEASQAAAKIFVLGADTEAALGNWQAALRRYDEIETVIEDDPRIFRTVLTNNLNWIRALIEDGRFKKARQGLVFLVEKRKRVLGDDHYRTAEAIGFQAVLDARTGDMDAAWSKFRAAVPTLMQSQGAGGETGRLADRPTDQRLKFILEAYLNLLHRAHLDGMSTSASVDPVVESFRIADRLRGGAVQRALAASAARFAIGDSGLADLARREQDTKWQINGLTATVASLTEQGVISTTEIGTYKHQIQNLRLAQKALIQEISDRFPDYASLATPKAATPTMASASLRPGEAMISTYVGQQETYVWAISHGVKPAFAAVDFGLEDMTDLVGNLRLALDPQAQTLGDIPRLNLTAAYELYRQILLPVVEVLETAQTLFVVPHGPLGHIPFALLPREAFELPPEKGLLFSNYRDVPWLVRTHAVVSLPSVLSLGQLRRLPAPNPKRKPLLAFGDPIFAPEQAAKTDPSVVNSTQVASRGILAVRSAPVHLRAAPIYSRTGSAGIGQLPRLPDTSDEVLGIAGALSADLQRSVFMQASANEGQVKAMALDNTRILVFATHGLVPGDLDGLTEPALALTTPVITGGRDDGLLTMGEILALKLDADWVVLSACNTASGQGEGAEALSGLGRAFFYAGTRALLATGWPVETSSATELTTALFRHYAENGFTALADALRQTQLSLIAKGTKKDAQGKLVFSYAHPLFWAPYSLYGDSGKLPDSRS